MNPERLVQIEALFHAARERQPGDRAELLAQADPEVRREVESLLAQNGESPLDYPAMEVAANLLEDSSAERLAVGAQLGPYKIESTIGAGGMGQVYKARDTRLGRSVAIKISSKQFNARFEREARAISALNHPHICTLYDVGPDYLVMELVEGPTLAERLKQGALSMESVLRYGAQIADALAAAHAQGIVHRDLKPGNIMVTKAGAKVLDFGLAKSPQDETLTGSQVVMGSPAYMAPEQREGKVSDGRTDIYALGLVLREMATGKNSESLETLPPQFAHVVERCLAKEPGARWQAVSDVKEELQWIAEQRAVPEPSAKRRQWLGVLTAICVLAALTFALLYFRRTPAETMFTRFSFPVEGFASTVAVSPDGRRVAFTTFPPSLLWIRSLDSDTPVALPGTEGASRPFWSADGRYLAFDASGKLKKIGLAGEPVQALVENRGAFGGAWSRDGAIIFGSAGNEGLYRVSSEGGTSTLVTTPRPGVTHRYPYFLPDSRHFIYLAYSFGHKEENGIYVGSLDSPSNTQGKRIVRTQWMATFAPPDYLLYVREETKTLVAQRLDLKTFQVTGEGFPVGESAAPETENPASFSASTNGVLAYWNGGWLSQNQLTWFTREGKALDSIGTVGSFPPRLSPDGKKVAFSVTDPQSGTDIWLMELGRGAKSRFTFDGWENWATAWSPDGSRIVFQANDRRRDMYWKPSSGAEQAQLVVQPGRERIPNDWSADGRFMIFTQFDQQSGLDLWYLPLTGERKPIPFLQTSSNERSGQFSPNVRFVAYTSDQTGRPEVFVQPFPPSGGKWQISTAGGDRPRWRRDGKELFFVAADNKVMSVRVDPGSTFSHGEPRPLFLTGGMSGYDVTADGQRLLIAVPDRKKTSQITVILNWTSLLKR